MDFTFVCPTELIAFNAKLEEFKKRNCQVLGVFVDSEYTHLTWKNSPPGLGGVGEIGYPLISDITRSISRDYDVLLDDESVALRGLFLIDREGIVRHQVVNDLPPGRNIDEVIRILDALQFSEKYGEVCPANWKPGEKAIEPTSEGIKTYLSEKR